MVLKVPFRDFVVFYGDQTVLFIELLRQTKIGTIYKTRDNNSRKRDSALTAYLSDLSVTRKSVDAVLAGDKHARPDLPQRQMYI